MTDAAWFLIPSALLLGIRHGFDLDHLATIDSITRAASGTGYVSRWVGFLFSLGHGLVVISISLVIGSGFKVSPVPEWLDTVGEGISLTFLFLFGLLNLWSVFQKSDSRVPTSLKNYWSRKLVQKQIKPMFILLIGMLFALSFDTFSQVILFSLSGSALSGCLFAALLGFIFMLGMMVTDGLNGLLVANLVQRAEGTSVFISRLTGLIIAAFSLILGIINSIKIV